MALLLATATALGFLMEQHESLTGQAMVYVLAVVIASCTLRWQESVVGAVLAVFAFNFFFVPPRWTLEVESREQLITLYTMLSVALVISRLASGLRRETGELDLTTALESTVGDGMRCCLREAAVLGPGTGRWPGLNAWYVHLSESGNALGAACVQPADAADHAGREHAQALCALLAQALWRQRLSPSIQVAQNETQRQQVQSTFLAALNPFNGLAFTGAEALYADMGHFGKRPSSCWAWASSPSWRPGGAAVNC